MIGSVMGEAVWFFHGVYIVFGEAADFRIA